MKILAVDDNKEIINFLKIAFKSDNITFDSSDNGKDGSYLARTNTYNVIILDLNLPEKDGLTVCKEIRSDNIQTPIIILSVVSELPTKLELFSAGADDYLTKPFSYQELLARINALSKRSLEVEKQIIKIGKLTVNTIKNEVIFEDTIIPLTKKEYLLFELLCKNKDQVLSRGVILEHIWDMNADPFSNTIEVHIRNIRKKIFQEKGKNIIKTVNSRGYLFDTTQIKS